MHIYRLVSESTIEENILHKSDQKRQLDHLAIQSGGFNTDFLQKFNPRELLGIQGDTETPNRPGNLQLAFEGTTDAACCSVPVKVRAECGSAVATQKACCSEGQ